MNETCLSWWYPKLLEAGLQMPETLIIKTEVPLHEFEDGKTPNGFSDLVGLIESAAREIGLPAFLRTGYTSNKHGWQNTCFVQDVDLLSRHVAQLVEYSANCDFMGLPTNVWVVRRMIPTAPLFYAFYGKMPITREFRFFVRDGVVEHIQPYWPPDSIDDKNPTAENWRELLAAASVLGADENHLRDLAERAGRAIGGYWSIDFLQAANGGWWLTDCAIGERSFKWKDAE